MMNAIGTVLLAVGFLMLTVAVLIRDPAALDANIGAGIFSLTGIPLGAIGIVLMVISRVRS